MAAEHVPFKTTAGNPTRSRSIGLLDSENPRDLLEKSQEKLSFLTSSFANTWDTDMSQKEINGLYWILERVQSALDSAIENMGSGE